MSTQTGHPKAKTGHHNAIIRGRSRDRGFCATSRWTTSSGLITKCVVPSRHGVLSLSSADGNNGYYSQTFDSAVTREGDLMRVLDVLAQKVGVIGVFSDWPASVNFYANCKGLK
jgi:hypothetical protein